MLIILIESQDYKGNSTKYSWKIYHRNHKPTCYVRLIRCNEVVKCWVVIPQYLAQRYLMTQWYVRFESWLDARSFCDLPDIKLLLIQSSCICTKIINISAILHVYAMKFHIVMAENCQYKWFLAFFISPVLRTVSWKHPTTHFHHNKLW